MYGNNISEPKLNVVENRWAGLLPSTFKLSWSNIWWTKMMMCSRKEDGFICANLEHGAWKVMKVDELIMNMLAHCVIMGENASFTNFGNVVMLNVRGKCTQGIVYTLAYGDNSFAGYPNVMQTLPRGWGRRHNVISVKVGRFVRWC